MLKADNESLGNIESQTLSETRMDLIINCNGKEFILELKKWKGQATQSNMDSIRRQKDF